MADRGNDSSRMEQSIVDSGHSEILRSNFSGKLFLRQFFGRWQRAFTPRFLSKCVALRERIAVVNRAR
jgi:hypothetical protein